MPRLNRVGLIVGTAITLAAASLTSVAAVAATGGSPSTSPVADTPNGARPDSSFSPADRARAIDAAQGEAKTVARTLGLTQAEDLHATDVERDADGTLHVRYSRTLGGLPVMGGDFVVHESAAGDTQGSDFASANPLTLDPAASTKVGAASAGLAAADAAGVSAARVRPAQKVVWAVSGIPRLAWLARVSVGNGSGVRVPRAVVVDARTGKQIASWDLNESVIGTGHSLYSGDVSINTKKQGAKFVLVDPTRGNSTTVNANNGSENPPGVPPLTPSTPFKDNNNVWGNGTAGNAQSAAVDAYYGGAMTWDFYQDTFGRDGIAGDGLGAVSRVHYATGYDNAFWSDACFCMSYGDGSVTFKPLVALDIAGHEMSHGVTSQTAGLFYFGDAGGLNEATSDIFGTSVEFYANNPQDKGDYLIGEKAIKPTAGAFLRRMDDPDADGRSYNCWSLTMGIDNPHYTSGPGNHFFYMLAEGSGAKTIGGVAYNSPTCSGAAAVQGIGRAKADQIWYRALTRYFVSTTGYVDARDNTIRAAIDLYGKNSTECKQVVKAWKATAVPAQYWTCAGGTAMGANQFGTSPGFEPPNASWSAAGQALVTSNQNAGPGRSGSWFGYTNFAGTSSNGTLSKTVTIPNSPNATLRFYMAIWIASGQDSGGNLITSGSGTVDVTFKGNNIGHFDQTYANATFQRWDIPVSAFAGQTGTLAFVGHENNPSLSGGYFQAIYDDMTLTNK